MWRVWMLVVVFACSKPPVLSYEARLATLQQLDRASDALPTDTRGAILVAWHRALFPAAIATRAEDLAAQLKSASTAAFYSREAALLPEMSAALAALEQRGAATDKQRIDLFGMFINCGRFDEARAFAARHPSLELEPIPAMRSAPDWIAGQPSAWRFDDAGNLVRHRIALSAPQVIVVSLPDCHFSANAMTAILADPSLAAIFAQHATLLAPQTIRLGAATLQAWNAAHPAQPTVLVGDQREWPMIDDWATPNFYFIRDGAVVAHVKSWESDAQKANVLAGLSAIGLYDSRSR